MITITQYPLTSYEEQRIIITSSQNLLDLCAIADHQYYYMIQLESGMAGRHALMRGLVT